MHAASGLSLHADIDQVPVPDDIRILAEELDFDPWRAISEGTLLAAVDPDRAGDVAAAWARIGIESWVLGRFESSAGKNMVKRGGKVTDLSEPDVDPFWEIFFAGL
jgi:hydrogenase maturation factor